jgi:hypothetical protein
LQHTKINNLIIKKSLIIIVIIIIIIIIVIFTQYYRVFVHEPQSHLVPEAKYLLLENMYEIYEML